MVNTTTEVVSKATEAAALAGLEEAGEFAGMGVSVSGQTAFSPIQLLLDQILQMFKPLQSHQESREAVKLSIFICKGIEFLNITKYLVTDCIHIPEFV